MMGYSAFSKDPALLKSHIRLFSVISSTLVGGSYPSAGSVFNRPILLGKQRMDLFTKRQSRKNRFTEQKHTESSVNKKFRMQQSVKYVILALYWNMKGSINSKFLEKGTSENNALCCQNLWQCSTYWRLSYFVYSAHENSHDCQIHELSPLFNECRL